MPKAFISYSRKDGVFARKLVEALQSNGMDTWIDWEDIPPTADWMDQIHKGIEEADAFVFLLSPHSNASPICQQEVEHAARNNKRLIPVVVDEVSPNDVSPTLGKLNWIFFCRSDDFNTALAKLNAAIQTDLVWVEAHRRLQVRALEWERRSNRSLLLRGDDLKKAEEDLAASGQKDPQPTDLQRQFLLESRRAAARTRSLIGAISIVVAIALGIAAFLAILKGNQATQSAATAIAANATSLSEANARATAQADAQSQAFTALAEANARATAESDALHQAGTATVAQGEAQFQAATAVAANATTAAEANARATAQANAVYQQQQALYKAATATVAQGEAQRQAATAIAAQATSVAEANARATAQAEAISQAATAVAAQATAVANANIAKAGELAALALTKLGDQSDLELAYMLAADGYRRANILQTQSSLLKVIQYANGYSIGGYLSRPEGTTVSANLTVPPTGYSLINWSYPSAVLPASTYQYFPIYSIAISPDGKFLAAGNGKLLEATGNGSRSIVLWDLVHREPIAQTPDGYYYERNNIAFSPDSKKLAWSDPNGAIYIWDITNITQNNSQITKWENIDASTVSFSPDGTKLAAIVSYNTLILWEVATGEQIIRINGDTGINDFAFSPVCINLSEGCRDVIAIAWNNGPVGLWDVETQAQVGQPIIGSTSITNISFSPKCIDLPNTGCVEMLASIGSFDTTITLWNSATGEQVGQLAGHTSYLRSIDFSPDGKILASGGYDNAIRMWDVVSQTQIGSPLTGHTYFINSVVFSPDGKTLVSGSADKTIRLWDVAANTQVSRQLTGHTSAVNSIVYSPTCIPFSDACLSVLVSGSSDIRLWNAANGSQIGTPFILTDGAAVSIAISPGGTVLASGSSHDFIQAWEIVTGNQIAQYKNYEGNTHYILTSIAFSPMCIDLTEGCLEILATGSQLGTISLWDVKTSTQISPWLQGNVDEVESVAFSPKCINLPNDGCVEILASGERAFVGDGTYAGTIHLWNVTTQTQIRVITGHTAEVTSVAFIPNGKILASGSADNTIRLWDVTTGTQVLQTLVGHTAAVTSVTFSPDGKILASGSADNTIRLWDTTTGALIGKLTGHTARVTSLAFNPDGKTLASGSADNTVRIWTIDSQEWYDLACQIASRNFTQAEWAYYFPGEAYQVTCPQWPAGK